MTAASGIRCPGVLLAVTLACGLVACTGTPTSSAPPTAATRAAGSGEPSASAIPSATSRTTSRPPLPTAPSPSSLPSAAPVQLTPVSSSPGDLGRIDIRDGSPLTKRVKVRLPAASGYTVTAGCVGRAGTLLRWSVLGTSDAHAGFLFGSTTPCNGAFVTDAAMANIDETTPARLEVSLDPGGQAATVVLRPAPTEPHL